MFSQISANSSIWTHLQVSTTTSNSYQIQSMMKWELFSSRTTQKEHFHALEKIEKHSKKKFRIEEDNNKLRIKGLQAH